MERERERGREIEREPEKQSFIPAQDRYRREGGISDREGVVAMEPNPFTFSLRALFACVLRKVWISVCTAEHEDVSFLVSLSLFALDLSLDAKDTFPVCFIVHFCSFPRSHRCHGC